MWEPFKIYITLVQTSEIDGNDFSWLDSYGSFLKFFKVFKVFYQYFLNILFFSAGYSTKNATCDILETSSNSSEFEVTLKINFTKGHKPSATIKGKRLLDFERSFFAVPGDF